MPGNDNNFKETPIYLLYPQKRVSERLIFPGSRLRVNDRNVMNRRVFKLFQYFPRKDEARYGSRTPA
jgi:uncharacterized protein YijF (DUF1287 family)